MVPRAYRHPDIEEVELVTVLAALAEPTRLHIVRVLADHGGECAWQDLDLPVARSTLSHHLRILREAGLLHSRTESTRCFVSLRSKELDTCFPGVLSSVLACRDR